MNNEKRLIDANGLLRIFNSIKYINPSTISIIQNAEIERCASFVQTAPTEKGEEWIPITYRHMDEEELWDVCRFYGVEHPTDLNEDEKLTFDCSMPDDGQRVLISTKWGVFADTSEVTVEDGIYCRGLEERGDWEGVTAWMPAPEQYDPKGGKA